MRNARSSTPSTLLALIACAAWLALCTALAASALAATSATGGASAGATAPPVVSGTSKTGAHKRTTSIATWFGPGMYGNTTACGQTLTPAVVGVANRTLPCGTLVQISYRGRTIVVPVLDRGPYANGANWDLTAGAAQALDVTETVRVATRVVGSTPNTSTLGSPAITPAESATGGAQASD